MSFALFRFYTDAFYKTGSSPDLRSSTSPPSRFPSGTRKISLTQWRDRAGLAPASLLIFFRTRLVFSQIIFVILAQRKDICNPFFIYLFFFAKKLFWLLMNISAPSDRQIVNPSTKLGKCQLFLGNSFDCRWLLSPWLRFYQYFCIALASLPIGEEEAP